MLSARKYVVHRVACGCLPEGNSYRHTHARMPAFKINMTEKQKPLTQYALIQATTMLHADWEMFSSEAMSHLATIIYTLMQEQ